MKKETAWNVAVLLGLFLAQSVRSVAFSNWPVKGVDRHMAVKEMTTFSNFSTEDLGLSSTDTDARVPQFLRIQKWPALEPTNTRQFHKPSAEAQARDNQRRKQKRSWQRQSANMEAIAKAKSEAPDPIEETPKAVEGNGKGKI